MLPKQYSLANEDSVGWNAPRDAHFIFSLDAADPEIHDFVVRRLADLGRIPSVERYGVCRETLMHLAALGFGISLIGEAATTTSYPGIIFRLIATPEDVLPYNAVWLPGNDSPALRRFLSLTRS